jgi:4-hydroxymandelate oxidase
LLTLNDPRPAGNDDDEDPPMTFDALRERARERLPRPVYDYYVGGADDETTVRANREAWAEIALRPRVLVDVSSVDASVDLLGRRLPSPVALAPTAFHRLAHDEGEIATARGAGGRLMVASSLSTVPIEAIVAEASGPVWLQLYVFRDRELSAALVRRAEAAGCAGLCLTVDVPVVGNRERDVANHFVLPESMEMANFTGLLQSEMPGAAGSGLAHYIADQFDSSLDWSAIEWLRGVTRLPVIVKGIQHPDDGRRAVQAGVDAVVVSNHGGRQLDGAEATARMLPDVVAAVEGRVPVLVDGGLRRGTDVARALALGATAVLVGRPYLWALATGGAEGVARALDTLDHEFVRALQLLGVPSAARLGPEALAPVR